MKNICKYMLMESKLHNRIWCTALLTLICIVFGLQLQLSSLKFKVFHLDL